MSSRGSALGRACGEDRRAKCRDGRSLDRINIDFGSGPKTARCPSCRKRLAAVLFEANSQTGNRAWRRCGRAKVPTTGSAELARSPARVVGTLGRLVKRPGPGALGQAVTRTTAELRIRIADGPPQRIHDKGQQHMPGEEAWLVGELRESGERKYHLATLPADADLKTLAATVKARWSCEQAHQQMKEELGPDHFEGRSWQGLHRHTLMVMIAYAFLQHCRLAEAKGEKNTAQGRSSGTTTTNASGRPPRRHRRAHSSYLATAMSSLQKHRAEKARMKLPK